MHRSAAESCRRAIEERNGQRGHGSWAYSCFPNSHAPQPASGEGVRPGFYAQHIAYAARYAARIRIGPWTTELQHGADIAGVELFRAWDDGEATVEVMASNSYEANDKIRRALRVALPDFVVSSVAC